MTAAVLAVLICAAQADSLAPTVVDDFERAAAWTARVEVRGLRTWWGPISYTARADGDGVRVRIEAGLRVPPGRNRGEGAGCSPGQRRSHGRRRGTSRGGRNRGPSPACGSPLCSMRAGPQ